MAAGSSSGGDSGPGSTLSKTALTDAIAAAKTAIGEITVDTDAANVDTGTKWILAADKVTYQTAIEAAEASLASATAAFTNAQKDGTKTPAEQ